MAGIRLARIAFTKLQEAIFGTRRVALESKKIAYESPVPVLSLLLYGSDSECWVVSAENLNMRLPRVFSASTGNVVIEPAAKA